MAREETLQKKLKNDSADRGENQVQNQTSKTPNLNSSWSKMEEEILLYWEKIHAFEKSISQRGRENSYVFYDGPPFATGLPHYGHILCSTVKDMVARYWTMKGKRVERIWGWDCHGLPVENLVEKELGLNSHRDIEALGIGKFNEACRASVMVYEKEWAKTVRRMGRWVDFWGSYKTMNNDYIESVWWGFKELYDKGLVVKDSRISLYCPRCATPLSNFEIAMDNSYQDVKEETVYVKFRVSSGDEKKILPNKNDAWPIYVLAWTTTPWTLIGNLALAVHPEMYYCIARQKNTQEYLIFAREKFREFDGEESEVISEKKGKELLGLQYEKLYPEIESEKKGWYVIAGDFVSADEGTGIVHMAAYGEEDYQMIKKHDLPAIQHIDTVGKLCLGPARWIGKWFKDLDALVIEDLRLKNFLFKTKKMVHSYPFCWRCETPLYYAIQPAWFIKVSKIRQKMISENEKINWYPRHLKHGRFQNGIETAPDWNITRSRYWGSPVPIWECAECKNIKVVGSIRELEFRRTLQNNYYLLRHGEATHVIASLVAGYPEHKKNRPKLTKWGKMQIQDIIPQAKELKLDRIIASDLYRIKQTVEILNSELKIPTEFDKRLREIGFGKMNNASISEYHAFFKDRMERFVKAPEGGETLLQLQERMVSVVQDLETKYHNKNILIVSHGDPLWMLEAAFSKKKPEECFDMLYPRMGEIRRLKENHINLHRPEIDTVEFECEECGGKMKRIPDVFDCWVESGSMPFAQAHYPFENKEKFERNFPAEFISEYVAQTRGWFYTMHVLSVGIFSKPSFKNVVTTGTILTEDGSKMSKSKKNFPDPWLLLEKYGADSLRLYLLSSPVMSGDNLNFSEKGVEEIYRKVILLVWNVFEFWKMFGKSEVRGLDEFQVSSFRFQVLDRWILAKLHVLIRDLTHEMNNYDIVRASRVFIPFINDLSTWYVRRSRDRFKGEDRDDRANASEVLSLVLFELSKLLAPFTPFLAERIYLSMVEISTSPLGEEKDGATIESVHLCDFPKSDEKWIDAEVLKNMDSTRKIVELALALRAEKNIKVRQPLQSLVFSGHVKAEDEYLKLIKDEVNVREVLFEDEIEKKHPQWLYKKEGDIEVALNLEITDELKKEGKYRDLVRSINALRKEAGLTVKDKVIVFYQTGESALKEVVQENLLHLEKDVLAFRIENKKEEADFGKAITIDGKEIWVGLKK